MERDFIESVSRLIDRDLAKLAQELELYADENQIWQIKGDIKNSAGNLTLHLCGNLQHFFGAVIGKTGYIRNREHEFGAMNIPRSELIKEIETTRTTVKDALELFKPSMLIKNYPENVFDQPMTCMHFFTHLAVHLGYHLGQINYHRRLIG